MADTFKLELATPERLFVDEQVTQVELPGQNGYIGILAGHAPMLSALIPGVISYTAASGQKFLAVDGGFVEVLDNNVRVLAERAEFGPDIQVDAARRRLDEANAALKAAKGKEDSEAAILNISQAQARLDAAAKSGSGVSGHN